MAETDSGTTIDLTITGSLTQVNWLLSGDHDPIFVIDADPGMVCMIIMTLTTLAHAPFHQATSGKDKRQSTVPQVRLRIRFRTREGASHTPRSEP